MATNYKTTTDIELTNTTTFEPMNNLDFVEEKMDKWEYWENKELNAIVDRVDWKVSWIDTPNSILDKYFQKTIEEVKAELLADFYLAEEFERKYIDDCPDSIWTELDNDDVELNKSEYNNYLFSKLKIERIG